MAKRTKIHKIFTTPALDQEVTVMGWVRNKRGSKNVAFVTLNDGSCIQSLQVVVDISSFEESVIKAISAGSSLMATGYLVASQGQGQKVELNAQTIEVLGEADPETYPLQPKKHSLEFLREIAHLRFRTNTFGAIFRIRHALAFAVHQFFNDQGFFYLHTPIITGSDAEGAGEMFRVTTLNTQTPPLNDQGTVDFRQDFFGKETNLSVSGQLEAELGALGLAEVYTFGPTFRAENSNTSRHLAEFWMIEPEMAFYDLEDNMDLAESFLKYLVTYSLNNCQDDLEFLNQRALAEEEGKKKEDRSPHSLIEKLSLIIETDFERVDYSRAVEILQQSKPNKKKRFQYPVDQWGIDLQSEHERFLVEKHFKKPVIIYNYPKEIKAFYMRQNEDGKTVAAIDVLFPGIGEIIGGSQREERHEKLLQRIKEMKIPEAELWWYLETRKYGTVPHSGFGLGFERLVQFVTGMSNIRDVIPFPRTPGNAEF